LIGRFIHKAKLVIQGHTKRGFYREIINRLAESGYAVKHPQLLKHYRRYSSGR
jgi:hypothetical protein